MSNKVDDTKQRNGLGALSMKTHLEENIPCTEEKVEYGRGESAS